MARTKDDQQLQKYGMDVLTVAVLSILLTAPIGALIIGLSGPLLLQKPRNSSWGEEHTCIDSCTKTHTHTLKHLRPFVRDTKQ